LNLQEKIVTAVKEMDFAVARHTRIQREKEEERRAILDSKLKPKAHHILKKISE
jgi:hypothetical protein